MRTLFGLAKRVLRFLVKLAGALTVAALLLAVVLFKPLMPVYQAHCFEQEVKEVQKTTVLGLNEQADLLEAKLAKVKLAWDTQDTGPVVSGFALPEGVGKEAIEGFIRKYSWWYEIDKKRTLEGQKYLIIIRR